MGVYAKDTESLEEVLCIVEHPWKSFKAHKPFARIGLAAFLVFYLPLGLIAAFLFEILIHLPYKLLFGPRRWCLATTDPGFWYDYVYASPRRKILMVHLQDEIMAAGLDGTIESACEKGARAQRTSAWTKMTVTWMWTNSIYVPPLAIPPRALWANDSLGLSQQDGIPQNQLGQRLPRVRHFTSIDEDFWVHTLSLVRRPASIAESPGKVVLARRFRLKTLANIVDSVTSLVLPFAHAICPRNHYLHRLAVIFLAFGPLFIILTISYEGLFYFAIAVTLVSWVRLEHRIHQRAGGYGSTITSTSLDQATTKGASSSLGNTKNATANGHASITNELDKTLDVTTPLAPAADAAQQRELAIKTGDYRSLTLSDARICLFFLFLLQSAFYSTGNIASISSFSLDAVYRLLPVFDPFSQGALLLLKLLAPFALVSANLGILTKRLRLRGGSLFAVVMAIGDYLTLRFFWEVRDEGSWLEIGESISMFVIASVLCVFVAGLEALSEVFVMGVEFRDDDVSPPQQAEGAKERSANGTPPRNGKLLGQST